jgi:hypothetical protein
MYSPTDMDNCWNFVFSAFKIWYTGAKKIEGTHLFRCFILNYSFTSYTVFPQKARPLVRGGGEVLESFTLIF